MTTVQNANFIQYGRRTGKPKHSSDHASKILKNVTGSQVCFL